VDGQVAEQGKRERDRKRTVELVGRLANAELVGEAQLLVTEEAETRAEPRLESGVDPGWVDRADGDTTVGDVGRTLELNQLRQLNLSLGSPGTAVEGQDQGPAVGHLHDAHLLVAIVAQGERGELVSD
jgi:hypothetical protein